MNPRAVTGLGVVSSLGVGREAFFEAMRAGVQPAPDQGTLEVPHFDAAKYLGEKGLRSLDRLTKLLLVATRLALHDAGLKDNGAWSAAKPDDVGIVVSNAYGSLEAITELDRVAVLEDARYINPSRFPLTVSNSAAGYASIWEDLRAVNVSVSDGNCGALDAMMCADVLLGQARAGVILVGGAEALSEALILAFQRLGATPRGEAIASASGGAAPKAKRAAGARLGEGAALVVLEDPQAARARGARVMVEIIGYGTAFMPPEREGALLHASPQAAERAIGQALADASLPAGEVDVVVSGVSGLAPFDEAELVAVSRTLGDKACIVAPKLALGETLGAGGAMAIVTAMAHLTGHARSHVVRGAVRTDPRTAIILSTGYYGNASALVMRVPPR